MPWEKSFDLDEATDKAIRIFRQKGYEGTSMSDLITGMGINKGSLYNAFGSKKALFDRALLRYDQLNRQALLKRLSKIDDPVEAVSQMFDELIAESNADNQFQGCLMVNTAQELPNHPKDVQDMVKASFKEFEEFYRQLITDGKANGKVPDTVDADETAKSLLSLVIALRVLARGTYEPHELEALKASALRLVQ